MPTLTIKGCGPAQPPLIFLRRRPAIEPTGTPVVHLAQGQTGGGLAAALDRPEPSPRLSLSPILARQFLETLYGPFYSQATSPAYLEVRWKPEGGDIRRRFYPGIEDLIRDMADWDPPLNYWVGVAPRKNNKSGKKEDCVALTASFGDVDCGTEGHKEATKYQTKAEALAAIEGFPLRPTILIDSGGGFQPYWLFREPVELNSANLPQLERINKGLALALGGDVGATDAARILRLPGTFNMKLKGTPRPVKIVWCEPKRDYVLAELAKFEAKPQAKAQDPRQVHQGEAEGYEAYGQKALADELAKLARTPAHNPGRNNQLNKSAKALGELVGAGVLERGSVEAALHGVAVSIGLDEVETQATIRSGLEAGMRAPRRLPEKEARAEGGSKRKAAGEAHGDPQGQEKTEPDRIPWVGHLYCVYNGQLALAVYDGKNWEYKPLANFQAQIKEEVSRDDGLRASKEFHITGSLDTGRPLPLARITAKEFDSLIWINREWGAAAAIAPGRSLAPHLVTTIKAHSQDFKRHTVFAHSGWRQINGVWRYLHGGGAIGSGDPVEVDLGENLQFYRLPEPGGVEAARASLRFLEIGPCEITAPLIACTYLAPFADLCKIDFSLWIYGPTGGLKSTIAALALAHFGDFTRLNLPGSWFSTVNSLEKLTFILKDALCVIDDFIPASTSKEFHTMTEKAGRIIYQAGNRSSRGRLAPDLTARPNYHPRCLIISTGEILLPGQRQSATARYLGIELDPKRTPIDKVRLTASQSEAHLYPAAMAGYLEHLSHRLDDVLAEIQDLWTGYRTAFQSGAHLRIPEIQAWLTVGFEMFLGFQTRMGAITQDQAYEMLKRAWRVFEALGEKHSRIIEGQRPTLKFLAVLKELFYQGRIFAESASIAGIPPQAGESLGWEGTEPVKNAEFVGWADESSLYLMPETTLRVVNEAIRRQGDFLSLGRNDLLAALAREGFIEPGKDGKNTQVRWIQGASKRVICLPLVKLTHDEVVENGGK
jgi:hypothetical protein